MEHRLLLLDTTVIYIDGEFLTPDESQSVRNHSPDGFNWGYCGSGPAQLALAVLLRTNPEFAKRSYQRFKQDVIARVPQGGHWVVRFTIDLDTDGALYFKTLSINKVPIIKLKPMSYDPVGKMFLN